MVKIHEVLKIETEIFVFGKELLSYLCISRNIHASTDISAIGQYRLIISANSWALEDIQSMT